jgi:predicted metalloprotease
MRYKGRRQSSNIEDRQGLSTGRKVGISGGVLSIVVVIVVMLLGGDHAQKMKNILEAGDIEEAVNAAQAVGDDRIQMRSQGYVVPDSFTHRTSEQRMSWFRKGFTTGNIKDGNTFDRNAL